MAGSIKGIIVEIGGDTSGLQNALKKVKSATASLSKELRGIDSLLKLDPKNTELLAQKQKVLSQQIKVTSEYLQELKKHQEDVLSSGTTLTEEQEKKYRELQREIINTENQLKQLKLEASDWTKASRSLQNFSDTMKNFGSKIESVGKKASVVSAGIAAMFSAGVKYDADIEKSTKAFEVFIGSAEDAEKAINNIKESSKTSIFNTNDLISANQALLSTGENAESANKTINALADAIALTGGGNDELSRMAANLQQIKNIGKASSTDIKQFGMAGIDVYGLLADSLGKTTEEIKDMDITYEQLSEAFQKGASEGGKYFNGQAQMADTLSGKVSKLKKTFQDFIGQLSQSLMPTITKVTDKLQGLVDWFSNLDDKQKETITKIGVGIAAVGPALVILGKVISTVGTVAGGLSKVAGIIAKVTTGAGGLSGALSALTGPVGIVIGAIAALTAAIVYLYNNNEEFRTKVNEIWQSIVKFFEEDIMPRFEEFKEMFKEILGKVMEMLHKLWETLEPLIMDALNWFKDFWDNTLSKVVKNVFDFVTNLIKIQMEIYSNFILPIISFLMDKLMPAVTWVLENVSTGIRGTVEFFSSLIGSIVGTLNGLITFIKGVFTGNWQQAWEGLKTIFSNIMESLGTIVKRPLNQIIDSVNAFIRGINNVQIPDWVPGVGGKGINIPQIPKLAKGGIVDKATLAMIGEGKSAEAVIPLDKTLTNYMANAIRQAGGSSNIVVNFYPQQMTDAELERAFNYVDRRYASAY